jgi:hypothetical protein
MNHKPLKKKQVCHEHCEKGRYSTKFEHLWATRLQFNDIGGGMGEA